MTVPTSGSGGCVGGGSVGIGIRVDVGVIGESVGAGEAVGTGVDVAAGVVGESVGVG